MIIFMQVHGIDLMERGVSRTQSNLDSRRLRRRMALISLRWSVNQPVTRGGERKEGRPGE
jgi:hypothetical protein